MTQDPSEQARAAEARGKTERNLAAELDVMARLQEVSTQLVPDGDDPTALLQELVDAAIAITSADMGNIQLCDRGSDTLRIVASRGFEPWVHERFAAEDAGSSVCGAAMKRGERTIVEDVETSPIFSEATRAAARSAGVRAAQSTPLVARSGQIVGVLSTHYRRPHRPAEDDLRLFDLLARQAADWIERTQAQEEIRQTSDRYRALVSQVKDYAIFSTDAKGVVATWNEGCEYVLGYTHDEFVALDGHELFTPEDRAAGVMEHHMRELAATGTTRDDRWMLAKGGRRFFAMGSAAARRDASGRLLGYSIVLRDTTGMKLAQEELARRRESLERLVSERTHALEEANEQLRLSQRMASLGTLAAGLGHDLGNLLLPLDVRLKLLGQADLPADLRGHVAGIESCVHYLRRLSNGLRLLATNPGTQEPAEPTELSEWWEEVGLLLKNVIPPSAIFEADMPRTECWVSIGRVALTQAVFNLVQNAADAVARQPAGVVRVEAILARPRDGVVVQVSDNGTGMTEEVARRCMEPYFSTKERGVSTGMGLALVHALTTSAGGGVEIDSTLGTGTTIALRLRRAKDDRTMVSRRSSASPATEHELP